MINPHNIGWSEPSQQIAEEFLLFCLFVQNKPAWPTAKKLQAFAYELDYQLDLGDEPNLIDKCLSYNDEALEEMLRKHRISPYLKNMAFFRHMRSLKEGNPALDVRAMGLNTLLSIPGIGDKTARFFLLYTQPMCPVIVIDTHMSKWADKRGIPQRGCYWQKETEILAYKSRHHHDMTFRDFDRMVWQEYAKN